MGLGGNSRKKNFDARIFSDGKFYLVHRWVGMALFGGRILRRSRMLTCKAEIYGGSHHTRPKCVISLRSESFHPSPNHVNHSIWPLSGSSCGGSMEYGLVGRKRCLEGVEITCGWSRRVVKSANITTECANGNRWPILFGIPTQV